MCGRYVLMHSGEELARIFAARLAGLALQPSFNIAPTHESPVVVPGPGANEIRLMRWGLIPHWAKDDKIAYRTINARAETVRRKPAFQGPFRRRRCVVPASGFYEWQQTPRGKIPHYIVPRSGGVLALAGLWDRWRPATGDRLDTFTIVTTSANRTVARLHDRMPVILGEGGWRAWLETAEADAETLAPLLAPCAEGLLRAYPVSRRVNRPGENDPGLIEAVADAPPAERPPAGETPPLLL